MSATRLLAYPQLCLRWYSFHFAVGPRYYASVAGLIVRGAILGWASTSHGTALKYFRRAWNDYCKAKKKPKDVEKPNCSCEMLCELYVT